MDTREQDRKALIYSLKVVNRDTGELLGYVVNMNLRGMMLLAGRPASTRVTVPLRIDLPRNVMSEPHLDATGEIRWCRRQAPDKYYIGIRLVDVARDVEDRVAELVERFYQEESSEEAMEDPYLQNTDPADLP